MRRKNKKTKAIKTRDLKPAKDTKGGAPTTSGIVVVKSTDKSSDPLMR